MNLKPNRILISNSEVLDAIYNGAGSEAADLAFTKSENKIDWTNFEVDVETILKRNFPLSRQVVKALKEGRIVLGMNTKNTGSALFAYAMDQSKTTVNRVYINMTKFLNKTAGKINIHTGRPETRLALIGGYETLYNILLAGYTGMNANRCYNSPSVMKFANKFYTDAMAQIISRNFGNPGDGVKFRFITDVLFHNGSISGEEVANMTMFNLNVARLLEQNYPDFFKRSKEGLKLSRYIEILNSEFKVFREPVTLNKLIVASTTALGDNAIYILDNQAYLLSVMIAKARRANIIAGGYMLRTLEAGGVFFNEVSRTIDTY